MDKEKKTSTPLNHFGLVRAVKTPLGFFVLIALVIEALLGTVATISGGLDRTLSLVGMLAIIFVLVAIVSFMAYQRPEALGGLRPRPLPVQATIVYPPTENDRYRKLFDGFSNCDFYAFNPPFQVEHAGKKILQEALRIHKKRYKSSVSSHYLFFDKESYEKATSFFNELANQVEREKLAECIERIYYAKAPEVPGYTFFIGKKEGKPAIVFYPNAVMENGIPRAVIYFEGVEGLHSILQEFFLKQWSLAKLSADSTLQPPTKSGG
jgi:hypothetical protein